MIEVGHWHAHMYIEALRKLDDVDVVAISDRDREVAESMGKELGCRFYMNYLEFIERETPDFVFAFGRHSQMPDIARALIERGINFSIEKPVALHYTQIKSLVELAQKKEVFASVSFVYRLDPMIRKVRHICAPSDFVHLYFRYITGSPERYPRWSCSWMLDKDQAGGGCIINLGVHYIDLFHYLTGTKRAKLVYSWTSNRIHGESIEDASTLILQNDQGTVGVIETAYRFPVEEPEQYFSFATPEHYIIAGKSSLVDIDCKGKRKEIEMDRKNIYLAYIRDMFQRLESNNPPLASLEDALITLAIVNSTYEKSPPLQ